MLEEVTHGIIGCAMRVHNTLGHGFPEVIYQRAMELEMAAKGMVYEREKELPINYRGKQIGVRRVDFFVEGKVMVELKAINRLEEVHIAQALNYLETYQMPVGLLINFGKRSLEFKRVHHHRGGEQEEHRGRKRDLRGMLNEEVWRRSCICIRWRRRRSKPANIESRRNYFDWLATEIKIDGMIELQRDTIFDNKPMTSAGIRLIYPPKTDSVPGLKAGILLEAGFDRTKPYAHRDIGSWALDQALATAGFQFLNNTATHIPCYLPGYTLVEKLQTIATKFRQEQESGEQRPNYMRQYYDVRCLLLRSEVQEFIGSSEYQAHKEERFPKKDLIQPIAQNEAFLLSDPKLRAEFKARYVQTADLYYKGQPGFEELLGVIQAHLHRL